MGFQPMLSGLRNSREYDHCQGRDTGWKPVLLFMSRRTERLASIIQKELGGIILHELSDPRLQGFPSITRVKVSPDLAAADIFVTVMGTPGQQKAALNALQHSAGLMRTRLTK